MMSSKQGRTKVSPTWRRGAGKIVVASVGVLGGLLLAAACGDDSNSSQACDGAGPSRTLSETCCLDYGVDACGAGLVCAALDGRTIPTCYAESTRMGLQGCNVDTLCASGDCNEVAGLCVSLLSEQCQVAVGCRSLTGERVACAPEVVDNAPDRSAYKCELVVPGTTCGPCLTEDDCTSLTQVCREGICTNAAGNCG